MSHLRFPEYLSEVTDEDPERRVTGALKISRDVLRTDSVAMTLVSHGRQTLITQEGYPSDVVEIFTQDRFYTTLNGLKNYDLDRMRQSTFPLPTWGSTDFGDTPIAEEVMKPAGFHDGTSLPMFGSSGLIFGFLHTNVLVRALPRQTEGQFRQIRDHLTGVARVLHERLNSELTNRELEILSLLREGFTTPEIAERLFISRRTASTHIDHILRKTGSSNRTQAAIWAARHGV